MLVRKRSIDVGSVRFLLRNAIFGKVVDRAANEEDVSGVGGGEETVLEREIQHEVDEAVPVSAEGEKLNDVLLEMLEPALQEMDDDERNLIPEIEADLQRFVRARPGTPPLPLELRESATPPGERTPPRDEQ